MTETSPSNPDRLSESDAAERIQALRRKQGTWVEWGQACQALQKSGYSPQAIFEETGFEPTQQNQVIVGAQVYSSILREGCSEAVKTHFERKGSDILYELRILTQVDRTAVAALVLEKGLDVDATHEVAKAVKEFARLSRLPDGFTAHPGDAVAHQSWLLVRQKFDLQERSRLIARGLRFAHSDTARQRLEQLLTDFSVQPAKPAPRLPVYRLEEAEELPRVLPVVGKLPSLTRADLQAVPFVEETGAFGMVEFTGSGAWVPMPGWQVIRSADDPVVLLGQSDCFPTPLAGAIEEVLMVVDRSQRDWQDDRYFIVEADGQLQVQWFQEAPEITLLGQVILVMRAKKVLGEDYTKEKLTDQQLEMLEWWTTDDE
jgi:hypothetical protein